MTAADEPVKWPTVHTTVVVDWDVDGNETQRRYPTDAEALADAAQCVADGKTVLIAPCKFENMTEHEVDQHITTLTTTTRRRRRRTPTKETS